MSAYEKLLDKENTNALDEAVIDYGYRPPLDNPRRGELAAEILAALEAVAEAADKLHFSMLESDRDHRDILSPLASMSNALEKLFELRKAQE